VAVAEIFWKRFPPKDYMETVSREERIEGTLSPRSYSLPIKGYVDWVVRDTRNGSVWIRDTKTTSRKFASILTGFQWSVQCRFYRLIAEERTAWGKDVKGFILDMIRVPSIRLCGKDEKEAAKLGCTPMEAYINRVEMWYSEQDETMASMAIPLTEPIRNPELMEVLADVGNMWHEEATPRLFEKDITRNTCYAYEKVCPYYVLCSSDPVTWPATIEQMFEVIEEPEKEERKET
jgi:hypothetical protein